MAWTTYSTRILDVRADSDADYRIVGKWFSDQLTALGWAKTADTGQIDWATATRPGAPTANTKGGYEIRKSSPGGGLPDIYIKISYGMGYSVATIGVWIATGEGSDGAGALTGDQATEARVGTAVGATAPYESTLVVAGDAGNFVMGATSSTFGDGFVAGVQRTCDASGADTATGWYQYGGGYAGAAYSICHYVAFTGGAASQDASPGWGVLNIPRAIISTSAVPCLPLYVQNGASYAPLRDVCVQFYGIQHSEIDVPMYGSTRRYRTLLGTTGTNVWGFTANVAMGLGIRVS